MDMRRARGRRFELLRFTAGGREFAASARHFANVRPLTMLPGPRQTQIFELGRVLGSSMMWSSAHVAQFSSALLSPSPWLGLGQRAFLTEVSEEDILAFPTWLSAHSSRHLLPACALDKSAEQDALVWLVDVHSLRDLFV